MGKLNKLSSKTKTPIPGREIRPSEDFYPDVKPATPLEDADASPVYRLDKTQIPTTTQDMYEMFIWEHGKDLYGSLAKAYGPMAQYRRDINKAWGQQGKYKDKYLDTFKKISDELKRFESI